MPDQPVRSVGRAKVHYEVQESVRGRVGEYPTLAEAEDAARRMDTATPGRVTIWQVTAEQLRVPWGTTDDGF